MRLYILASSEILDFEHVQVGHMKVMTVQLHNERDVPAEWSVKKAPKKKERGQAGRLFRASTRPTLCSDEPSKRVYNSDHTHRGQGESLVPSHTHGKVPLSFPFSQIQDESCSDIGSSACCQRPCHQLELPPDPFTFVPSHGVLAPGERKNVKVQFIPTAAPAKGFVMKMPIKVGCVTTPTVCSPHPPPWPDHWFHVSSSASLVLLSLVESASDVLRHNYGDPEV